VSAGWPRPCGKRVPLTGRARGTAPDTDHPAFAVEHKAGRVMSSRLLDAVDQAMAAAEASGKIPLVSIDQFVAFRRLKHRAGCVSPG
jgi:hypothetical protein